MIPRISTVVMTHPDRIESAQRLVDAHPDMSIRIVLDPRPDGPPAAVRTARRAWSAMPGDASHHLVLQDDVRGTAHLGQHVTSAVAAMPDSPLCFFTEWGSKTAQAVRMAALCGDAWAEIVDHLHTSQAVLLPAALVRQLQAHMATPGVADDDAVADADLLFGFLRERGTTPLVSVPNLVEHIELPSLLGNDILRGPRHSPCFDPSLPTHDWGSGVWRPAAVLPQFSTRDARSYCHLRETGGGWTSPQTVDWLRERGLALPELVERFRSRLGALPAAARIRAVIAETMLFELWVTAYAAGVVLREHYGLDPDTAGGRLRAPVADRAWASLVPGALRKILPLPVSHWLAEELRALVRDAVSAGGSTR
ncbi:hypothetical protein AB0K00_22290 [Dactylosporangium sp. NPDC049525]|uniref:hypothetical protein n=1 Tax=Dactylosporangium sp. NPDC049525 TaxID=3154730 RepID=UPI0034369931